MAQIELKVSTQQLLTTASEFSSTGNSISSLTADMVNISTALAACSSDSTTTFINKLKALEPSIQKMNRMIQEHVTDLQEITKEYETSESTSVQEAEALQTDIIS